MNQVSSQQTNSISHAGFLVLLLVILGVGAWARHYLVDHYLADVTVRQAQQVRLLADELVAQHHAVLQEMLGNRAPDAVQQQALHSTILDFWPSAWREQLGYRIFDADGVIRVSVNRVEEGLELEERSAQWLQSRVWSTRYEQEASEHPLTDSAPPWLHSVSGLQGLTTPAYLEVYVPGLRAESMLATITRSIVIAMLVVLAVVLLWLYGLSTYLQKRSSQQAYDSERHAHHDDLTGLPNRILFWDRISQAMAHAKRDENLVALIRINVDRFQRLNHALGHSVADRMLQELAQRLKGVTRASDTVTRMCADDFAIIIGEIERKDEIEKAAQRFMTVANETYVFDEHEINITTRVGIAVYPTDHQNEEKLLMAADAAMQKAKQTTGSQRIAFYTPELGEGSAGRLREEHSLRQALEEQQFELHYQPKVDSTTGRIKGFEALIRWRHPERGLIPPLQFIPILEESGLIIPVGEWVIREACAANQRWQSEGLPGVPISVNVSAPQFEQENFTRRVKQILDDIEIEPRLLEIEITESCLMSDAAMSAQVLNELKSMGLSIAVDDFGTGYSSLSHLKRFPIDTLKIDRSFVTNVNKRAENDNASIVTAIMALSHSLRLDVVAEGVETAQELAYLHALGCRTIQGFLFSRPLVESEVISLLHDSISLQQVLESVRDELKI